MREGIVTKKSWEPNLNGLKQMKLQLQLSKWLVVAAWCSGGCSQPRHWLRLCAPDQISQYEKEKFNKLWREAVTNYISDKSLFPLLCAFQNKGEQC